MNRFIRQGLFRLSTKPVDNSVEKSAGSGKKGLRNAGLRLRRKNYAAKMHRKNNELKQLLGALDGNFMFWLVKY